MKLSALIFFIATILGSNVLACVHQSASDFVGPKMIVDELRSGGLICNLMRRDGTAINGSSTLEISSRVDCGDVPAKVSVKIHNRKVMVRNIQRFDEGLFGLQLAGSDFAVATCQLL